ncbi:MAG: hypothetical protein RRY07_01540 [Bacteroidaceae bacterium]
MATKQTSKILRKPAFMKKMSEERQSIVDTWLLRNDSMDKLALKIQEEWKLCGDIARDSLVTAIQRYKRSRILPKQAQIATQLGAPEHVSKLAALETQLEQALNPITAMENLIAKQMARVQKMESTEARMPTLMDVQTKNMALLWGMLDKYTALQIAMGIIRRAPKKDSHTSLSREQLEYVESLKKGDIPMEATMGALQFLGDLSAIDCTNLDEVLGAGLLEDEDEEQEESQA